MVLMSSIQQTLLYILARFKEKLGGVKIDFPYSAKNIILNDNLFIELFKNGRYPRKECDFTGNDIWGLVEKCVHILVEKQMGQNYTLNILVK